MGGEIPDVSISLYGSARMFSEKSSRGEETQLMNLLSLWGLHILIELSSSDDSIRLLTRIHAVTVAGCSSLRGCRHRRVTCRDNQDILGRY